MREGLFIIGGVFGDTRKKISRTVLTLLFIHKPTNRRDDEEDRRRDILYAYATT